MTGYEERERLPISAIKQYSYCNRRFALMFIDNEWADNYKIIEGNITHEKVNDPFAKEKRKDIFYSRSVPVFSKKLNLYGIVDIIEFLQDVDGVAIGMKKGLWRINPIEYKNGKPEKSMADNLQLCAIAMCLEEMFRIAIGSGEIYYGKLRKRVPVDFCERLRSQVCDAIEGIISLLHENTMPPKPEGQNCKLCSLADICLPGIFN